jgi:hypothetical protein
MDAHPETAVDAGEGAPLAQRTGAGLETPADADENAAHDGSSDECSSCDGDPHEHCFSLLVSIRPGAVPTAVDADGNLAYRRSDLVPFARNLPEFVELWATLLRRAEPGSTQILALGGQFDRAEGEPPSLVDEEAPPPAGDVNWALVEEVQKAIRFEALPDGYFASLKGKPEPRGMWAELHRAA